MLAKDVEEMQTRRESIFSSSPIVPKMTVEHAEEQPQIAVSQFNTDKFKEVKLYFKTTNF